MKKSVVVVGLLLSAVAVCADDRFSPLGLSVEAKKNPRNDMQCPGLNGSVYGWRMSLFSGAHRNMVGLATAVFANVDDMAGGYVGGLQSAALFNTAENCELGVWQISGFYNGVAESCNGLQVCAICNKVDGYCGGLQIAGVYNEVAQEAVGMQIGLCNKARTVMGIQIGLLNFGELLQGVQLGLLNFVEDSKMTVFPVVRIGW